MDARDDDKQLKEQLLKVQKEGALSCLTTIIKTFNNAFDPAKIDALIKIEKNENRITIYNDYKKIANLSLISIPYEGEIRRYCRIIEKVSGVTEKIPLVSFTAVDKNLHKLLIDMPTTVDSYINNKSQYALPMQAILKLPKKIKVFKTPILTEVQREALALDISEMLGFKTTGHKMLISHNGEPRLFVPFDNIKQLKEFASAEKLASAENKIDVNDSTIKPVGEGLLPDQTIEDFGKSLAYFYLCNDPDAFGGYNQNKALINDKYFYIFDQAVHTWSKTGRR